MTQFHSAQQYLPHTGSLVPGAEEPTAVTSSARSGHVLAPASGMLCAGAYLTDAICLAAVVGAIWLFFPSVVMAGITVAEVVVVLSLVRARTGRTPGALITRTAAVTAGTSRAPGLKRQLMRTSLMVVLHLTVVGPLASILLNRDGQDWMDRVAGTASVNLRAPAEPAEPAWPQDAFAASEQFAPVASVPLSPVNAAAETSRPPDLPGSQSVPLGAPAAGAPPAAAPWLAAPPPPPIQPPAPQGAPAPVPWNPPSTPPVSQPVDGYGPPPQTPWSQPGPSQFPQPQPTASRNVPVQQEPRNQPDLPQAPRSPARNISPAPAQDPPTSARPAAPQPTSPHAGFSSADATSLGRGRPRPPADPVVGAPGNQRPAPIRDGGARPSGVPEQHSPRGDSPAAHRAAAQGPAPASPPPSAAARPEAKSGGPRRAAAQAPDTTRPHSTRQPQHSAASPTPVDREPEAWLVMDSGQREKIDAILVIGREPFDGTADERLITVDDPTYSLSRTHMRIGIMNAKPWVEDAFSTNGTVIRTPDNKVARLESNQRTAVPFGTTLILGERTMQIVNE